jgi:drug/metabolite transporter (DMT)-like permease
MIAERISIVMGAYMIRASMSRAAFLCLLAGGCAIAFAPILVRLSDTGPVDSAFWRCALAAPLLWIWVWRSPSPLGEGRGGGLFLPLLAAGIFFALDLGVWHFSILYTSVANSTLLANLAPIFVTLAGWLIWKQKVTRPLPRWMTLAIVGMFVLVGPNFAVGGTRLLGDALGALTGAFYAGYMLAIKQARDANASTARLMAWSTTITAIALLPVALIAPHPFLPSSANGWLVLVGLALVTQILGQGLIAYAFAHLAGFTLVVSPPHPAGDGHPFRVVAFRRGRGTRAIHRRRDRARGHLDREKSELTPSPGLSQGEGRIV